MLVKVSVNPFFSCFHSAYILIVDGYKTEGLVPRTADNLFDSEHFRSGLEFGKRDFAVVVFKLVGGHILYDDVSVGFLIVFNKAADNTFDSVAEGIVFKPEFHNDFCFCFCIANIGNFWINSKRNFIYFF